MPKRRGAGRPDSLAIQFAYPKCRRASLAIDKHIKLDIKELALNRHVQLPTKRNELSEKSPQFCAARCLRAKREREREAEREREGREREREREKQRDRETERQRENQREREPRNSFLVESVLQDVVRHSQSTSTRIQLFD